ncbi:MAG: MGMT family protein [Candidatus Paceibacterota bacterium]
MFKAKVIAVVKAIPKGKTMTYGEVAKSDRHPHRARRLPAPSASS